MGQYAGIANGKFDRVHSSGWVSMQEWWVNINKNGGSTWAGIYTLFYENAEAVEVRDKCFISKEWRTKNNLSNIKYWLQRNQAKDKESESIEKEAFLLYLNDDIKYLSFEDTITACKRCASSYDLQRMDLCPQCKVHYKGIQYPTCIPCLPEDKRKSALESIEFGKEWQEMHRTLGID